MSSVPTSSPSSPPSSSHSHKRRNSVELLQFAKRLQEKYLLHEFWIESKMGKIQEVDNVADVDIAEAGCFKYILIDVSDGGKTYGRTKTIVRGDASCAYHADVLDKAAREIDEKKLTLDCTGGGRMRVDPKTRTISVYGYSQGFGRADHDKTVEILKKNYPQWTIQITDEEY